MRIVLYDGLATIDAHGDLEFGVSAHFRLTIPGQALARAGHEIFTAQTLDFDTPTGRIAGILPTGERITGADVLLIKNGVTAAETLISYANSARRNGQVIVHDFCDWPVILRHRHPMVPIGWTVIHKRCDAIFVNTEYLERRLGKILERPTYFIPSALDTTAWEGVEPEDVSDGPVLGWHGIPFFRKADLALFRGWLGPFMEKHDLRLIHAGKTVFPNPRWNIDFAAAAGIDPERVEVRDGVPAAQFPTSGLLNGVDIGLAARPTPKKAPQGRRTRSWTMCTEAFPTWAVRRMPTRR